MEKNNSKIIPSLLIIVGIPSLVVLLLGLSPFALFGFIIYQVFELIKHFKPVKPIQKPRKKSFFEEMQELVKKQEKSNA